MKKIVIFVLVFLLFVGAVAYCYFNPPVVGVGTFSVNEFSEDIEKFSSNEVLGEVLTGKAAIQKAEKLWIDLYGKDIVKEKPYKVYFDEENQAWLVNGSLPYGYDGGVAYVIIRKTDGKVLAVWHEK